MFVEALAGIRHLQDFRAFLPHSLKLRFSFPFRVFQPLDATLVPVAGLVFFSPPPLNHRPKKKVVARCPPAQPPQLLLDSPAPPFLAPSVVGPAAPRP